MSETYLGKWCEPLDMCPVSGIIVHHPGNKGYNLQLAKLLYGDWPASEYGASESRILSRHLHWPGSATCLH